MSYCSQCTHLNIKGECNCGKFWCTTTLEWSYADKNACDRYCEAYSRSAEDAEIAYNRSVESRRSGCYLTTVMCEILKFPDKNVFLQTLRKFREQTLQKDEKYKELLVEYDIVGPIIANKLKQEKEKQMIARNLFVMGIVETVYYILNEEPLEAIKKYTDMTKLLIQAYNIDVVPTKEQLDNADISLSGHGVYVKSKRI